jgi:hypothetical protein
MPGINGILKVRDFKREFREKANGANITFYESRGKE